MEKETDPDPRSVSVETDWSVTPPPFFSDKDQRRMKMMEALRRNCSRLRSVSRWKMKEEPFRTMKKMMDDQTRMIGHVRRRCSSYFRPSLRMEEPLRRPSLPPGLHSLSTMKMMMDDLTRMMEELQREKMEKETDPKCRSVSVESDQSMYSFPFFIDRDKSFDQRRRTRSSGSVTSPPFFSDEFLSYVQSEMMEKETDPEPKSVTMKTDQLGEERQRKRRSTRFHSLWRMEEPLRIRKVITRAKPIPPSYSDEDLFSDQRMMEALQGRMKEMMEEQTKMMEKLQRNCSRLRSVSTMEKMMDDLTRMKEMMEELRRGKDGKRN